MKKTYTVAGFSTLKGDRKFRVANNLKHRITRLAWAGHTDIELQELPEPMTRSQAFNWIMGWQDWNSVASEPEEDNSEQDARDRRNARRRELRRQARSRAQDALVLGSAMHQPV